MSIAYAILVSLSDCPKSGYDLAKAFDGSVGFFWQATHQQIYRELTKLESQNWISAQVIAQSGRPDKKLFSLTDLGQTRLKEWISQPCQPEASKDELMVKVFAGYLVAPEVLVKEITRQRQLHAERLAVYQEIDRQMCEGNLNCTDIQVKYAYLTLRRGIRFEQDWIEWCDESIDMLA